MLVASREDWTLGMGGPQPLGDPWFKKDEEMNGLGPGGGHKIERARPVVGGVPPRAAAG